MTELIIMIGHSWLIVAGLNRHGCQLRWMLHPCRVAMVPPVASPSSRPAPPSSDTRPGNGNGVPERRKRVRARSRQDPTTNGSVDLRKRGHEMVNVFRESKIQKKLRTHLS